jgi:hypothetical protein
MNKDEKGEGIEVETTIDIARGFPIDKTLEMLELICQKLLYFQTIKNKDKVREEVVSIIHWISDYMPYDKYPYLIDTIKNDLWESISL